MVHPLNAFVHHSSIGQTFSLTNVTPRMDVIVLPKTIVWYIELPGLSKSDVKVNVQRYHVSVEGAFPVGTNYKHHVLPLSVSERRFGRFDVSLVVPHGLAHDEIDATMGDGVLRIEVPRKSRKGREQGSEVRIV